MTAKQQIATGLLAAIIVCSVAFMPANADSTAAAKGGSHPHPVVAVTTPAKASAPAPVVRRDTSHDLTYN